MEIKAQLNYLRIAPRKVRLVANLVKGMDAGRAELELKHSVKRSAIPILKLLKSGIANAKHNFQMDSTGLYIKDIKVNEGPVLKRSMPRAFGRAAPIRKKSSHIVLVLDTHEKSAKAGRKRPKKEGPVVRDITVEDMKEEFIGKSKDVKETTLRGSQKEANFVRRMFRRKAI